MRKLQQQIKNEPNQKNENPRQKQESDITNIIWIKILYFFSNQSES